MSKTFTLAEVNDLELSAAENATILERERIIKLLEELDIGRCCYESHDLMALIKGPSNE